MGFEIFTSGTGMKMSVVGAKTDKQISEPNRDWLSGPGLLDDDFKRALRDNVNWSLSSLGSIASWPTQLRQNVLFLIEDSRPACIIWGRSNNAAIVYNGAYASILATEHPSEQGQFLKACSSEVNSLMLAAFQKQLRTGSTWTGDRSQCRIQRGSILEECFISHNLMPLLSLDASYQVGVYATVTDHTAEILQDRRTATLHDLDQNIRQATSLRTLWHAIIQGLSNNPYDLPLVLLYSAKSTRGNLSTSIEPIYTCTLEGALGIVGGHSIAPSQIDLDDTTYPLGTALRQSSKRHDAVDIHKSNGTLPADFFKSVNEWRGHGVECNTISVCAIRAGPGQAVIGFCILGLNPLLRYDAAYREFVRLLNLQMTVPYVSQLLLEQEIQDAKKAAKPFSDAPTDSTARTLRLQRVKPIFIEFAEHLPTGIAIADEDGNLLCVNAEARRIMGIRESAEPFEFMHNAAPEEGDVLWRLWTDMMAGKSINTTCRMNVPWTAPDGTLYSTTVLFTAFKDVDSEGRPALVSSIVDVSELKYVEARFHQQQNEAKFRKFADHAPVGMAVFGIDRKLQFQNQSFTRMMSPTSDNFLACIHPEDVETVHGCLSSVTDTGHFVSFECRPANTPHPSAQPVEEAPRWILVSASPGENDQPDASITCWVTDITAQKAMQDMIQRRMEEALEMKRQQEQFIDMTSHEIRNPLSALLHCTEEILENNKSSEIAARNARDTVEAASTIEYCARHIRNIVGDVLTLSKLDSKLVKVDPQPVRLRQLIQRTLTLFKSETRAEDITLGYKEEESIGELGVDWLALDPHRFAQVLINLITNAIKFTKSRPSRNINIRASACREPPPTHSEDVAYIAPKNRSRVQYSKKLAQKPSIYLMIAIEDTGVGIKEEERILLFQRFKQASPKTESTYGGSGLGLFICRDLTELQGGGIGVSSTPGTGSKFVFYVETRQTIEPAHMTNEDNGALPPPSHPPALNTTGRSQESAINVEIDEVKLQTRSEKIRILVVEDNLLNAKVLARQLEKRGFEVEHAVHGEQALRYLQAASTWQGGPERASSSDLNRPFDIVLMDMEMPVMDGITCTKEIRALEERVPLNVRLPIIAVTANARDELTRKVLDAGADAITTKPYRITELVAQIEKVRTRDDVSMSGT